MKKASVVGAGRRALAVALSCALAALPALGLSGCGAGGGEAGGSGEGEEAERTFVYGTTGYGVEMDDAGLNPHENYSGWSCVRYGVGETLFKFSDEMEPEPWLATGWEFEDDTHCTITLREGVTFSSGREMDGEAVEECLEDLVEVHERAAADLKIASISSEGYTVTIETEEPSPSLVDYLCDPYCAIVDMEAGVDEDGNVSGTGPYVATSVSDTEITLEPNEDYWDGEPQMESIVVRSIEDGDTLTAALQSGEIDAAYGLPYASYELVDDESAWTIESCDTSRTFFGQVNSSSEVMRDASVREALSMGIDREGFVETLLSGRGAVASGPFTEDLSFGDGELDAVEYDPEGAEELLEEAGWVDQDGDGVREKDGRELSIVWLTYPGRAELPLLAEYAQKTLGEIGFDVEIESTESHTSVREDLDAWDVYVSALVTAPTGDPEYFFSASCVTGAAANYGGYSSEELDALYEELHTSFDEEERDELAVEMQELLLEDGAYFFASHLTMGIVSTSEVTGLAPHPCDYYEITADLAWAD